jgi:hypothetical protein
MIGKGLIKTDDYIKFGKVVDELSKYCYTVNYVPSKDNLVICFHKKHLEAIKSKFKLVEVKVPRKGILAFAKVVWR